jgi:hypothetical protein
VETLVLHVEPTQAREAENTEALASTREDAEGLVWKVTLLEGELAELCQAQEAVEMKFHKLSDASADGGSWQFLRRYDGSSSRRFLFCGPGALCCVWPSPAHHG